MNNLNTVLPNGTFGVAVSTINSNFSLIVSAINSLEYASTKSRGIYNYGFTPSTSTLPNAVKGDWCMVLREGNVFPADIWTYNGTSWTKGGTWNPEGIDLTQYAKTSDMNAAIAQAISQVEIETVDNLNEETAASGKALDAHQGFVLAGQIEGVKGALDELKDEVTIYGDNEIIMEDETVASTSTTYLTAEKDLENNGVTFTVVAKKTSGARGQIKPFTPTEGKRYRLSFDYLNTAASTTVAFRTSGDAYIAGFDIILPVNSDYQHINKVFDAPANVGMLGFVGITSGSAGTYVSLRNIECVEISSYSEEISSIENEVAELGADIEKAIILMSNDIHIPVYETGKMILADTGGTKSTAGTWGHSNYIPTNGAKKIYIQVPQIGSSMYGIAFYATGDNSSTYMGGYAFDENYGSTDYLWRMYDVPDGANYFRTSMKADEGVQYRLVVTTESLMQLFKDAAAEMIATQIIRNAIPVSEEKYIYAFGTGQLVFARTYKNNKNVGVKAYTYYDCSETTYDSDDYNFSVSKGAEIDIFDMSVTQITPQDASKSYADGSAATGTVGYSAKTTTPDNHGAVFALLMQKNNNPYYCYCIYDFSEHLYNWVTCKLEYTVNGVTNNVDFTVNNYRQMLVDIGYTDTYRQSTADVYDNINLHYDAKEGIYYAVLCQGNANLPLVLMESSDMATWRPKANLGTSYAANEIAAVYKDGIAYVAFRTASSGTRYLVYDVANNIELSSGLFPQSKILLSKPDVFIFGKNVYMAVNSDYAAYGLLTPYSLYRTSGRQQLTIYKVVDGVPKKFRTINNPTGIQYPFFVEAPRTMHGSSEIAAQSSIYLIFTEDRRHMYERQLGQVSFADVTALFVDNGRIV